MIKFNKSITIKGLDSDDNDNCDCKDDDEDNVQLRVNPCDRCHTCGKSADSLTQISVGNALFLLIVLFLSLLSFVFCLFF